MEDSGSSSNEHDPVVKLNVGGTTFETYRSTLTSRPDTLLGTMFSPHNRSLQHPNASKEYFFDRNPRAFAVILDYYRTGRLNLQSPIDLTLQSMRYALADSTAPTAVSVDAATAMLPSHHPKHPIKHAYVGLSELREELDFFQIPESSWSPSILLGLHTTAAARISRFVDTLFDLVAIHMDNFIDIVVVHFARGEDSDSASLRNVNRSVEHACVPILDRLSCGFRLLSDEKLASIVRETLLKRFPTLKATVQMVRHELLVLCLSGYLDIEQLRLDLGIKK